MINILISFILQHVSSAAPSTRGVCSNFAEAPDQNRFRCSRKSLSKAKLSARGKVFLKIPLRPPLLHPTQRNGAKIRLRVPLGSRILATVIVKAYDNNLMMARMGLTVRRICFVFIFPLYRVGSTRGFILFVSMPSKQKDNFDLVNMSAHNNR